jgi:2-amino-4-hydroxy-6-hydroxymethyldihydropteridine diphosphokinase
MNAPQSVVIALGTNLGDRRLNLRRAVDALGALVRLARLSSVWQTAPVDAPAGSGPFLNMAVAGWTRLSAPDLLERMHAIEAAMGRVRRRRNEPRVIDLDLILYGATLARSATLALPHPRYRERAFVLDPLRELGLAWSDPARGVPIVRMKAGGAGMRAGSLY